MQERRKTIRREADRRIIKRVKRLQTVVDRRSNFESEEAQRKRRRAIRHHCRVSIKMVIGHAAGASDNWALDAIRVDGRVLDLSSDGASLFTKQAFEAGQQLRIAIRLREGITIDTSAVVRWVKAVPEKHAYATGVQFEQVTVSDQERIRDFLSVLDANVGLKPDRDDADTL